MVFLLLCAPAQAAPSAEEFYNLGVDAYNKPYESDSNYASALNYFDKAIEEDRKSVV